jgi:superfamily II DNA/RNA helicase
VTAADVRSFSDLGVDDAVVESLTDAGIIDPFPIQELSLPMALQGADLIGQARTGTGKTLAFGIPLVQRVDPEAGHTQALVVVPTRELCLQVHDDLVIAGAKRKVKVVAAYGGRAIDPQSEAIAAGAPIVVGTPGRLLDLVRRGLLDLSRASMLVLDEADEMLDMGFLPDVEQLIEKCARQRQTLLFSATVPSEVVRLARRYMNKPTFMRSDVQQQSVAPQMRQFFFACHRLDKPAVVARILASPNRGRTLIFTRTKRMADVLASELRSRNINAGVIHSDLRQEARERALVRFREGTQDVLCATEVAARGLDIDQVTHVVNYDCPDDERMYLHRIGRTGRAGAAGVAVTLAVWNELARLEMIKKALQIEDETHEVFSTSPLLDDIFGAAISTPATTGATRESDGGRGDRDREDRDRGDRDREDRDRKARDRENRDRKARDRENRDRKARDREDRDREDRDRERRDRTPKATAMRSRGGPRSRRTRRRRQRGDSSPVDTAGTRDGDRDTEPTAARDRRDDTGGATGDRRDRADDTSPATAAAGDQRHDTAETTGNGRAAGEQRDDGPAAGDRRPSRGRDGGGRGDRAPARSNGDSGRSRGRRSGKRSRDASQPVVEPVSPASRAARGAGKPALNRPLEISHLP